MSSTFLKKVEIFLVFPSTPPDPLTVPDLQQGDVDTLVEPVHSRPVVVHDFPGDVVPVPKLVRHFCVPLSFLSVSIIAWLPANVNTFLKKIFIFFQGRLDVCAPAPVPLPVSFCIYYNIGRPICQGVFIKKRGF